MGGGLAALPQELIIQNFVPKKGTAMEAAPRPPLSELLWTVAVARLLFGPEVNGSSGAAASIGTASLLHVG